jgi:3-keto-5-aminohexanoate cleavage enzyme
VEPLIIEAAINEQSAKERNPHVPYSAEECAEDALRCVEAGAGIIHLHARDPVSGALLSPGTETYGAAMRLIAAEQPEVLVYPTYTMDPMFEHVEALAKDPEVRLRLATVDPGAMNFSSVDPETGRILGDTPFVVSHAQAAVFFELCRNLGINAGVVLREPGHVRTLAAYHRAGVLEGVPGRIVVRICLADSMLFGLPPSPEAVRTYLALLPEDLDHVWMAYTYGPSHDAMNRFAVASGGHVRTGLGDNPVDRNGSAPDNVTLVRRAVALAEEHGRPVATPAEVRTMLGVAAADLP